MSEILLFLASLLGIQSPVESDILEVYNSMSQAEQELLEEEYLDSLSLGGSANPAYHYDEMLNDHNSNPVALLNDNYSGYTWTLEEEYSLNKVGVPDPLSVNDCSVYPNDMINSITNQINNNWRGGCGPCAMISILDHFKRNLNYTEIIDDLGYNLSYSVLSTLRTIPISGGEHTTLCTTYSNYFNNYMRNCSLDDYLESYSTFTLFGNMKNLFTPAIKLNLSVGQPITLFSGPRTGNNHILSNHIANITGYYTYKGTNEQGQNLYVDLLKVNPNFLSYSSQYVFANYLNHPTLAFVFYIQSYENTWESNYLDFEYFVNDMGQGQYFFYEKQTPLILDETLYVTTNRLRSSLIEDSFLVMSPNRYGAGNAFIDINFPDYIDYISFDSALWSSYEKINDETFKLQIKKIGDTSYSDYITFDLSNFSTNRFSLNNYIVKLPHKTSSIRFIATKNNPDSSENRGRIVLDNLIIKSTYY